jgi:hypothetical protein
MSTVLLLGCRVSYKKVHDWALAARLLPGRDGGPLDEGMSVYDFYEKVVPEFKQRYDILDLYCHRDDEDVVDAEFYVTIREHLMPRTLRDWERFDAHAFRDKYSRACEELKVSKALAKSVHATGVLPALKRAGETATTPPGFTYPEPRIITLSEDIVW